MTGMTDQEHIEYLQGMEDFIEQLLHEPPEFARDFLIKAGIFDSEGNLTEHYRKECTPSQHP